MNGDGFAVLYGSDPWHRSDGGSARVQALHHALEPFGVTTLYPAGSGAFLPPGSRRKEIKQRYLPLPLRRRALLQEMAQQLTSASPAFVLSASHSLTPVALSYGVSRTWVDHFDRWSDFGRREAAHRRGLARLSSAAQAAMWERRERRERDRYALATTASHDDACLIRDAVWLPTPVRQVVPALRPAGGRRAGLLANFGYWPNRDAYELLVVDWLPELRRQGWTVVVGGYEAGSLAPVAGVENIGPVASLDDFYDQVDLTVAPIRLGAGMKVKVVESLAHGRPVLATPEALTGLPPALLPYVLVGGDVPGDLAEAVGALDPSTALTAALEPFQPAFFTRTVRALAEQLRRAGG